MKASVSRLCGAAVLLSLAVSSAAFHDHAAALDTAGVQRRLGIDIESSMFDTGPYVVRAVSSNAEWTAVSFSVGGSYLLHAGGSPSRSIPDEEVDVVTDDGEHVFRVERSGSLPAVSEVVETRVGGAERRILLDLPVEYFAESVLDVDRSRSTAVVAVESWSPGSASAKTALVDLRSGSLVTPLPGGLPGTDHGSNWARLSDDGTVVVYNRFVAPSVPSIATWNRSTGERTTTDPLSSVYRVSDNGQWAATTADLATTGLTALLVHLPTGLELEIPIGDVDDVDVQATDEGRVFLLSKRAGGDHVLSAWDPGDASPTALTTGPPGSVAAVSFWPSADGTRVVFDGSDETYLRRPFVTDLPSVVVPNATAIVQPAETYCFAARGAEPGDVVAVNLTPVAAATAGYATMHSSNDGAGETSSANFDLGTVDPNVSFAVVGDDGDICVSNSIHGAVHLVADEIVIGDATKFRTPTDAGSRRLADTRIGLGGPRLVPNEQRCISAAGAAGEFAITNVTPVLATTAGFGTMHSSDVDAGATSNVNFGAGTVDPNIAIVEIGSDGRICFTNSEHGQVDIVIDQLLIVGDEVFSAPTSSGAERLADTRIGQGGPRIAPNETRCVAVVGAEGGDWVGVNVTPVLAATAGFGTMHSSDDPASPTSSVNFAAGTVDPNVAFTQVGNDGEICFTNSEHGEVDLVLDQLIVGSPDVFRQPSDNGSVRLADTRLARF